MSITWKDAESEFESFFEVYGKRAYVERLKDTAHVRGASGKLAAFKDAQPADYIVTVEGAMFYAEVKSTQHEPSFPFSMIKPVQWAAARRTVSAGGIYRFYIRRESTKRWYSVPANVLIHHTAKSIRWQEIEGYLL